MEDIIKSIKACLYDRVSSPLFGSFLISWIICNYKFFVIIVSNIKPHVKLSLIDQIYSQTSDILWFNFSKFTIDGFIHPLLLCLAYIYIYPVISEPVYGFTLNRQKRLRELKQAIENSRLLTVAESQKLIQKHNSLLQERESIQLEYSATVSALNKQLEDLKAQLNKVSPTSIDRRTKIRDALNEIYKASEKLEDGEYNFNDIISSANISDSYLHIEQTEIEKIFTRTAKNRKIKHLRCNNSSENKVTFIKSSKFERLLTKEQEQIVRCFENSRDNLDMTINRINTITNINIDRIKVQLEVLIDRSLLLKATEYMNQASTYKLTDKGLKYLVENNFIS